MSWNDIKEIRDDVRVFDLAGQDTIRLCGTTH